jgi:hypothetical protein
MSPTLRRRFDLSEAATEAEALASHINRLLRAVSATVY